MKKIIGVLLVILFVVGGYFGYQYYQKNYANNVAKEGYFHIYHGADFEAIVDSISPYIKNKQAFIDLAMDKNMNQYFKPGRYHVKKGNSNKELVYMIKMGNQSDLSFRIGPFNNVYKMIGRVTKKTEVDSLQFANTLNNIAIKKGFKNAEDLKHYFFIDTYNFFWTVTPDEFFKKFEDQYNQFWTPENIEKEKKLQLNRQQVYALASIVFKESGGKPDEMKTIAGLYINRYHKGMKLQSDPTVIYAIQRDKGYDLEIKRVLYSHLRHHSPYNTYANTGIPPGPICITDKNSVEAVLNAENNNYIYMCADPDKLGFHRFTDNAQEHLKNAKDYQNWLNKQERLRQEKKATNKE